MRRWHRHNGFLLLVAVILVAAGALIAVVASFLFITRSESEVAHLGAAQALSLAEAGIEDALYRYRGGTPCNTLTANVSFGAGGFAASASAYSPALRQVAGAAGVTATARVIPVNSIAGYPAHGRIRIDNEQLNYSGTSTDAVTCSPATACFTGAVRGVAGTTPAAHALNASVYLNECLIRSMGTTTASASSAARTVELAVPVLGAPWVAGAASVDGASVTVTTTMTNIATLPTRLPAGANVVLAVVSFRDTGTAVNVNAGNLQLARNGSTVASNQFVVRVGGNAVPSATNFPTETMVLLYSDPNAPPDPTYLVRAAVAANSTPAEAKIVVLGQLSSPLVGFSDGVSVLVSSAALTTLNTLATTFPAGDNVVLAAVQLDNTSAAGTRFIAGGNPGNLRLRRGTVNLAANFYQIDLATTAAAPANRGTGGLLFAKDANAPANASYNVVARASNTLVYGNANIVALGGMSTAAFMSAGALTAGSAAMTTLGTLNTSFPAGTALVLGSAQFQNSLNTQAVGVSAGNFVIQSGGATRSQSEYDLALCRTGISQVCNDFLTGLMWLRQSGLPNPSFTIGARTTASYLSAWVELLAIPVSVPAYTWKEIFP